MYIIKYENWTESVTQMVEDVFPMWCHDKTTTETPTMEESKRDQAGKVRRHTNPESADLFLSLKVWPTLPNWRMLQPHEIEMGECV